ncbi:4-amino-4-deoxy-L-arabinose transferase-like glycosyltransferase [Bradyrhizobium japonicum]|jgi:Dolichyl-phosphate-mannose-protein mannosyltransferase|uniref:4-amino-4-deoxy-L-arabinose transferase-like glycosyltransferase n=1 Tax=Bradyrhizobium elkanii TaxID=29448 RepID=A0A1E3EVS9_BRAEL|nr:MULTISPECIES: glycosyltransferase family 39 protein [Bradyrhizobium]MBP1298866.1 4-amino-4-deoxy-L-arabinose transferase-like glycosyltransferase [Bradyrhizobium elkanii]MBP2427955.1 4-amino-4-deoxy-L-arabinose transferase-like glycosyltransferase [Bradyrhizobium elkanii]MCP1729820.1 4-amino-4-deoxy-L-arabinose transferase-like glycosyltransferase [Bradyrhizobium elkanii]MCP1971152.1 4-amino-4-deoxy-L-arabinose transferase-like glycosyltransferase [Bradyrhizobium elkanii]MCS3481467.1 4-amin
MSSITTSALEAPARRSVEKTCDDLAVLVLGVVAVVAGLTFRDYGLGWDDYTHAEYADLLLRMYESGFKDTGALSFANLYMYGGGFDMAAALLHKIIPLELFETRRLLGAIVGVIGLAVTWRLARRVGGPLAGLAALLLLALCPTFYGHMFMNPKDAPFAVAMVVLIMGLVRLIEEYPAPSPRTILIVGLGAGLSIGCRVLGGLALIYAVVGFVPLLIEEFRKQGPREATHRFAHVVYVLLPGLVLGYLVMGLIWPWSIMEPGHPLEAVTYFSHFFEKPWKEMFDGALVSVPDMPWSYLPTLFALQLPEVLLVLLAAAVVITLMSLSRYDVTAKRKSIMLMLTLAATLPLVIAMVKRPALYNGIRHFIFVIPPMTVLAGVAFARGMDWLGENRRAWQPAALAVFAFGLLLPLSEMIRLHPYQYTHFNHIAGTVRTADNFFMLDYWGLALKQASDGLREQLAERQEVPPQNRKWKVAVCGPQRPAQVALGPDFTIGWDSNAADFAMTLGEFYCKGLAAPVMVEIKRDDVVFARVYDIRGRSISSLLAIPAP